MIVRVGKWEFHKIQLKDSKMYSEFMEKSQYPANLFRANFTHLWCESQVPRQKVLWKIVDGMLATFYYKNNKFLQLSSLPLGTGDSEKLRVVLGKCLNYCRKINGKYRNKTILKELHELQLEFLKRTPIFDRHFTVKELKGVEVFLGIEKTLALKGRDFGNVRQNINKFHKMYPHARIRKYLPSDYASLIELKKHWNENAGQKYYKITDDIRYRETIKHYKELGHLILIAEINGQVVGMISGEVLPNGESWNYFVKKNQEIQGLSEVLIVEFARLINTIDPKARLLNIGDDYGVKGGLSRFKKKFNPILRLKRYRLYLR